MRIAVMKMPAQWRHGEGTDLDNGSVVHETEALGWRGLSTMTLGLRARSKITLQD